MSEGGLPPGGMSFPQKIHTEDEDFVIELEENMASPQDGYMDDRSRCKRRKRCGQCGPCQVKENCMKCHFCIRKDVLKQTCIYRKCVYLRSKPKPYSRPHQSPQGAGGRISSPREINQASPVVKSPPASAQAAMFPDQGMPMSDGRPAENPFYPPHLPQPQSQQQPPQPMGALANHGYVSPPNPMMERAPSIPSASAGSSVNMNMQMNMAPPIQNHATSPPVQKVPCQTPPVVPQSVNSPPAAVAGVPQITSCGNIPLVPSIPPVVPAIPPVLPPMSNSSLPPIPSIPSMSGIMNERAINDFRHPEQLPLPPHHPHPHFPSMPPVHPHMSHRDANFFGEHSRVPHMNFNPTNHVDSSFSRGPNDSSCMYHPGLPYSMPGPFPPSGPSFLSGAADINPFRSNFLNSFPPGYSYPPDRYREGFSALPFSRLGMSASASFPQYPGQGSGYGMGNSFSQQYSPYNSQHGCPKNGSRPPVSPSTDDVQVLQEGYKTSRDNEKSSSCRSRSGWIDQRPIQEGCKTFAEPLTPVKHFGDSSLDHVRLWNELGSPKIERSSSVSSTGSRPSYWDQWRVNRWLSPRRDEVRSRTSTLSSDFECEISIDDQPMNALVRSDGCNSIEIEFDDRYFSASEEFSPRKNSTDISSSVKHLGFQPIRRGDSSSAGNQDGSEVCEGINVRKHFGGASVHKKSADLVTGKAPSKTATIKTFFKEPVCLKQDLGDEGIIQLELPGHRVSIEDIVLDDTLACKSSDQNELRRFLTKELQVE